MNFELNVQELDYLMAVLMERPYKEVAPLITNIVNQANGANHANANPANGSSQPSDASAAG